MTTPSIKTLMTIGIDEQTAVVVRAVLQSASRNFILAVSDAASERERRSYNPHSLTTLKLDAVDELIETHGVEYIPAGHNQKSPAISYCNAGDTYTTTLLHVNGSFRVGCWGDIVERGNYD